MSIQQTNIRVIAGFPGVGKSNFIKILGDSTKVIDLDSSNYRDNDINEKMTNYTNTIKALLTNSTHLLLVSTHKEVLAWLEDNHIEYILIHPDYSSVKSEEYISSRFNRPVDDKVFKERISGNWDRYRDGLLSTNPKYRIELGVEEFLSDYIGYNKKPNSGFSLNINNKTQKVMPYTKSFNTIKTMLNSLKDWTLTNVACRREYDTWSDGFTFRCIDDCVKQLIDEYGYITELELSRLTDNELNELGFAKWNSEGLRLIPIGYVCLLDSGMTVTSISGDKKQLSEVDKDHRCGMLAFGIYPIDPK